MDNQLPDEFDIIIVGTGMVESIVSAAASRIGKKVLHVDRNDYYGGHWASFNLDAIQNIQEKRNLCSPVNINHLQSEYATSVGNDLFNIENVTSTWHIPETEQNLCGDENRSPKSEVDQLAADDINVEGEGAWTKDSLLKKSRKFNIDLIPKLQYARGGFVELLISSNIARYSEYRSVSRVLTWLNGQLEEVPCSRSDVFANTKVSVIEKRMLMKLLTSLDDGGEELKNYENKTFRTFLKDRKLSPNLIHYVLYAISMSTDDTPCLEGVENTKRFLNSLGRFGKTPFLFSMYGSGELTQAFCRLSAVFGGIYALSQPLSACIFDQDGFKALVVGQQRIKANDIVMGIDKSPKEYIDGPTKRYISRAVFILDRSIMDSEKEHLTLLLYPPENGKNAVTIIEMGSLTGTCPKNVFMIHLISKQNTTPKEDFEHVVGNLFATNEAKETVASEKPQILWSLYFSLPHSSGVDLKEDIPKNVFVCPGPDLDLDYDLAVEEANKIFSKLYPDMEFLPRAPDPEEIVFDDEEERTAEPENIVIVSEEQEESSGIAVSMDELEAVANNEVCNQESA